MANLVELRIANDDDQRSIEVVFRGVPDDELAEAVRLITQVPFWIGQAENIEVIDPTHGEET